METRGAVDLVFVYGTLMRGFGNHGVMRRISAELVGDAVLEDYALYAYGRSGCFPIVVFEKGHVVEGELYRVPWSEVLGTLDEFEGHPTFYQRKRVVVRVDDDGSAMEVWTYALPDVRSGVSLAPLETSNWKNVGRSSAAPVEDQAC